MSRSRDAVAIALATLALPPACSATHSENRDGGRSAPDGAGYDAPSVDASALGADVGAPVHMRPLLYLGQSNGDLVVHAIDPIDGALEELSRTRTGNFPSFAAAPGSGRALYVVHEASDELVALGLGRATGAITVRNRAVSGGSGPAHVSLDRSGRFALIANYGSGTVRVVRIRDDGQLGEGTDTESPGANAHAIVVDPTNRWVLVPCLGDDRIAIFRFDPESGGLDHQGDLETASGAGPRHVVFDAAGTRVYSIHELDSTIGVHAFDPATGALTTMQTLSSLPDGFDGRNSGAEILLHPSGRFVYASNRGHAWFAIFEVGAEGRLAARGHALLEARTPRSMAMDPGGRFLYAGALDSNRIVRFEVQSDGSLTGRTEYPTSDKAYFVGVFEVAAE